MMLIIPGLIGLAGNLLGGLLGGGDDAPQMPGPKTVIPQQAAQLPQLSNPASASAVAPPPVPVQRGLKDFGGSEDALAKALQRLSGG